MKLGRNHCYTPDSDSWLTPLCSYSIECVHLGNHSIHFLVIIIYVPAFISRLWAPSDGWAFITSVCPVSDADFGLLFLSFAREEKTVSGFETLSPSPGNSKSFKQQRGGTKSFSLFLDKYLKSFWKVKMTPETHSTFSTVTLRDVCWLIKKMEWRKGRQVVVFLYSTYVDNNNIGVYKGDISKVSFTVLCLELCSGSCHREEFVLYHWRSFFLFPQQHEIVSLMTSVRGAAGK